MATKVKLSGIDRWVEVKAPEEATNRDRKFVVSTFEELDAGEQKGLIVRSLDYQDVLLQHAITGASASVGFPVTRETLDDFTLDDYDLVDEAVAAWVKRISVRFSPDDSGDPESPTDASDESEAGSPETATTEASN